MLTHHCDGYFVKSCGIFMKGLMYPHRPKKRGHITYGTNTRAY